MAEVKKACRQCGYLTKENTCPMCNSNAFAQKYKGKALIFDSKTSIVAEKLSVKNNGQFALKHS